MIGSATISTMIAKYGVVMVIPLAIIAGPLVVIAAAYMARLSLLRSALDHLSLRFREKIGASPARIKQISEAFRTNGVRVLLITKLTQVGGFVILMGAGAAHMPFARFILINVVVSIPKSLALVAIGYYFGGAHELIEKWFYAGSAVIALVFGTALVVYFLRKQKAAA
jgi:membrane-associated protein